MKVGKIKELLFKIDKTLFNENIKGCYSKHLAYRGKAYKLTKALYFPPHASSNKNIRMGIESSGELLAFGGDLTPERMILAYKKGIYPLFFDKQPILWWTSEIRYVLFPQKLHIGKKMRRIIKKNNYVLTADKAFRDVICACRETRKEFTWITPERIESSCKLHELGFAHSIEIWQDERLVGGLYGVMIGSCFQVESMFRRVDNAATAASIGLLLRLSEIDGIVVDCGFSVSEHIKNMGAEMISRDEFLEMIEKIMKNTDSIENWNSLFENWNFKQAVENHFILDHKT